MAVSCEAAKAQTDQTKFETSICIVGEDREHNEIIFKRDKDNGTVTLRSEYCLPGVDVEIGPIIADYIRDNNLYETKRLYEDDRAPYGVYLVSAVKKPESGSVEENNHYLEITITTGQVHIPDTNKHSTINVNYEFRGIFEKEVPNIYGVVVDSNLNGAAFSS
jgi:hypothetical protein